MCRCLQQQRQQQDHYACCKQMLPLPFSPYYHSDIYHPPFKLCSIDFNPKTQAENGSTCLLAGVMESEYAGNMSSSDPPLRVPLVLEWSLSTTCSCKRDSYGNPYNISNGCQVADECKRCSGKCDGSWDMEGTLISRHTPTCDNFTPWNYAVIIGVSVGFSIIFLVIGIYGLYRFVKRRKEIRQRAKIFKRNGGLLLQQQLSSREGAVEKTRIFSMSELDKATDHFNENRILGHGGQGTVYKGMLTDGGIVAIKKAKLLDESQLEQFINEVVILSQINHRNVVKLLGCCLETEIPLLVYEFVPNGTLFQHIHDPDEDFVISWKMCLKIAADSAAAIAYLHSYASSPIYHRDIKSSNILLDEKHKAKVSDFGSSRTVAIDQTHLTTLVQGTMGYLDPEYFKTYQFTEKSDVYSFGVVLLELLTRKRAIYWDARSMDQKNLATEFLLVAKSSRLSEIIDPKVIKDAKEDELIFVVELVKRCISWTGKLRPTMKEVAVTLEMIIESPTQVSRLYQEQEPFSTPEGEFDEYAATAVTDTECFSTAIINDSRSPPNNDVNPLLPNTEWFLKTKIEAMLDQDI